MNATTPCENEFTRDGRVRLFTFQVTFTKSPSFECALVYKLFSYGNPANDHHVMGETTIETS